MYPASELPLHPIPPPATVLCLALADCLDPDVLEAVQLVQEKPVDMLRICLDHSVNLVLWRVERQEEELLQGRIKASK